MPNPHGRTGAKMLEPSKDSLRDDIDTLRAALLRSERRRIKAERRLETIESALKSPIEIDGDEYADPWVVLKNALSAVRPPKKAAA